VLGVLASLHRKRALRHIKCVAFNDETYFWRMFGPPLPPGGLDHVVRYFHRTARDFKHCVPCIAFPTQLPMGTRRGRARVPEGCGHSIPLPSPGQG